MKKTPILEQERKYASGLIPTYFVASVSGFATWLFGGHGVWEQFTWLVHVPIALTFTYFLLPYIQTHLKRTLGFKRWSSIVLGFMLFVTVLLLILSGIYIALFGITETQRWLIDGHRWLAVSFIALIIIHMLVHWFTLSSRRKSSEPISQSFGLSTLKTSSFAVISSIIFVGSATWIYQSTHPGYSEESRASDYQYLYGNHPFRPSQTETASGTFVDIRQIAGSEDCAVCHKEVYEEWQSSIHRHAAGDITYERNVSLMVENKGIAASRYCEGCHSPVALLTGELSEGGVHGGIEGSVANEEGVTCMSCHGMQRVVHLKGVASYEFAPATDYLFDYSDHQMLNFVRHTLMKWRPEQHRADLSSEVTSSPTMCATCHVQFMDKDLNNWGWVKMQDEYSAWLESAYSRAHDQMFSEEKTVRCQDCHMHPVSSTDPSRNESGQHRSHRFLGANTFVPILNGDSEQLAQTKKFLQQNKMRVVIEESRRTDAVQTSFALDEQLRPNDETPYYAYINEELTLSVLVSNIGVGHNFPGGTIDINEAWLEFMVMDGQGDVIFSSGELQGEAVDPSAVFFRSLPTDKAGNLVWKHDLFNRVGQSYKRVVPSGKAEKVDYSFTVPADAKGPITTSVRLRYRKLNPRYARWAMQDDYFDIPVIDMARASLTIPLKLRPPAESVKY